MIRTGKVAFATDDGSNVNQHFGRLAGFVVVALEDGIETGRTFRSRPEQADQPGERRHNHAALLDAVDDCSLLVAGGMGMPMAHNISQRGIQLVLTSTAEVDVALSQLLSNALDHEPDRAHQPRH